MNIGYVEQEGFIRFKCCVTNNRNKERNGSRSCRKLIAIVDHRKVILSGNRSIVLRRKAEPYGGGRGRRGESNSNSQLGKTRVALNLSVVLYSQHRRWGRSWRWCGCGRWCGRWYGRWCRGWSWSRNWTVVVVDGTHPLIVRDRGVYWIRKNYAKPFIKLRICIAIHEYGDLEAVHRRYKRQSSRQRLIVVPRNSRRAILCRKLDRRSLTKDSTARPRHHENKWRRTSITLISGDIRYRERCRSWSWSWCRRRCRTRANPATPSKPRPGRNAAKEATYACAAGLWRPTGT